MDVMTEVEDAISFKISKLIDEGPLEELTKTENAQPAIFATGIASTAILEKEYGYELAKECKYLAGHSLGEYTALCAAGVLSIRDAARLVRLRGELMNSACPEKDRYAMVALIGADVPSIEELVKPYQTGKNICVIANDNSPSQVVISGHRLAVSTVTEESKKFGVIKAIDLNTSGPFHSPLMAPAAIEFDGLIQHGFEFRDFRIPVIMNVLAQPVVDRDEVHGCLTRQITGRVRWRDTIEFVMADPDVDERVEVAPGRVLTSMIKRSYPDAKIRNLETVAQMEELVNQSS
jgi:[acyl-carrier-protein] S-malonyltransferase